jgi:hypothetical protein
LEVALVRNFLLVGLQQPTHKIDYRNAWMRLAAPEFRSCSMVKVRALQLYQTATNQQRPTTNTQLLTNS